MDACQYPDTVDEMALHLLERIGLLMPTAELRRKAELAIRINRLKREKRAIILGHNYMEPALYHSIPDYTGDSLHLSRIAARTEADIIVFCGVRFMAETAKILNPGRTVLLPSPRGGCSLAEAIQAEDVRRLRALYPGAPVVSYVNTYAEVKAESDYCCTSGNATEVVRHLLAQGERRIIFLPDEYLAANTAREAGIRIIYPERDSEGLRAPPDPPGDEPVMVGWRGRCEVHDLFTVEDIRRIRRQVPDVKVLAHPECRPEVVQASDFAGSTAAMIRYVQTLTEGPYLLLTECSMGDNIAAANPSCQMLRLCSVRCPHMKEVTLEETLTALLENRHVVEVPGAIAARARAALDRMIRIG